VWFVDGRVAKSDIVRSLVHRWEGEKTEVALKVGVRHQQGGVRGERARWCLYTGTRVMREREAMLEVECDGRPKGTKQKERHEM
jgi:hypothetical protein